MAQTEILAEVLDLVNDPDIDLGDSRARAGLRRPRSVLQAVDGPAQGSSDLLIRGPGRNRPINIANAFKISSHCNRHKEFFCMGKNERLRPCLWEVWVGTLRLFLRHDKLIRYKHDGGVELA